MNKQLQKTINANPTLKAYCATLESIGFQTYNVTEQMTEMTVLAKKKTNTYTICERQSIPKRIAQPSPSKVV